MVKEGAMSKAIVCFLAVVFLLVQGCGAREVTKNEKITSEKPVSFKIQILDVEESKNDPTLATPTIEYDPQGFTFYEVERSNKYYFTRGYPVKGENDSKEKVYWFVPKFDNNGNPLKLSPSDPEYLQKLLNIIFGELESKAITGEIPPHEVGIGIFGVKPEKGYKDDALEIRIFSNQDVRNTIILGISMEELDQAKHKDVPTGSIVYIDSDYNYQIWLLKDGKYILDYNVALNPDTEIGCGSRSHLAIREIVDQADDVHSKYQALPHGFIWMKLGDKDAVVAGEQNRMTIPMEVNEGYLTAPTGWLIGNLDGTYSMDKNTGVATVYRKHGTLKYIERDEVSGKEQEVTINLKAGDKKITVNGKSEELPIAVYEKDGSLMVPLRKMCEYLGGEYHFRHADNTVLIARFPKSEN